LLTCKDFLSELSDYLDDTVDCEIKAKLEEHIKACPNCWVVCDTTRKTIQVYKGHTECAIPADIHARLMAAIEKKCAERSK
jgi:anti-sigma factor RsiW